MKTALIYHDGTDDPYPWHFTVEHDPPQEDSFDYGSVESLDRAAACVTDALRRRSDVNR